MEDGEGNELKSVTRNFSVSFTRSLDIPDIDTIHQKQQTFSWTWTAEDLNNFTYTLEGLTN
jgi:hypothetical protein